MKCLRYRITIWITIISCMLFGMTAFADTKEDYLTKIINYYGASAVLNNGSNFVGYQNNVYYWQHILDNMETSGLYGYFNSSQNKPTPLICRDADGNETILLQETGVDTLYIADELIYFNTTDYTVHIYDLNGTFLSKWAHASILGCDSDTQTILISQSRSDHSGSDYMLFKEGACANYIPEMAAQQNPVLLGLKNGYVYYAAMTADNVEVQIWKASEETGDSEFLGSLPIVSAYSVDSLVTMTGNMYAIEGNDAIYFTVGYLHNGTGHIYSDGNLFRITYDGALDIISQPVSGSSDAITWPYLYLREENGHDAEIYYAKTGTENSLIIDLICGELNFSCQSTVLMENVSQSDYGTAYGLQEKFAPLTYDGGLASYLSNDGILTNIATREQLEALGLKGLGDYADYSIYVPELDLVGNIVYFPVYTVADGEDLGWRQGYDLKVMHLCEADLTNGTLQLIR